MSAERRAPVLHPFLLCLYFIVFLVGHNMSEIILTDALAAGGAALLACLLVWLALRAACSDSRVAGNVVSVLVFSFFTYGRVHDFLLNQRIPLHNQKFLVPFWVLATALLVFLALRLRRPEVSGRITAIANLFSLVLLALPFISIIGYVARPHGAGTPALAPGAATERAEGLHPLASVHVRSDDSLPDVYYIILDGYSRADTYARYYGYDNSAFAAFLKAQGFLVAEHSTSNYDFTSLSLASSLNAAYLDPLTSQMGEDSNDTHPLLDLIRNNAVTEAFRSGGYRIVQIGSWWQVKSSDSLAQPRARYRLLNEFNILLVSTSILSAIDGQLLAPLMRANVLDAFTSLEDAVQLRRKFVFAHILCPHPPYLFGRDGRPLGTVTSIFRRMDTRTGYLDQSIFVTDRISRAIETVLKGSSRPPIIILQSDHGSGTVWSTAISGLGAPTTDFLQAQFGILNAYLVPADLRAKLYDSISPVNTFRLVLNQLSDTRLPLLEDRSYFSTFTAPYRFQDVTRVVRGG